MDSKRTLGTIGLAVALGAVAGALAGSLTNGTEATADGDLRKEIARLDSALEESTRELTRAQRELVHLKDRMSDAEIGIAKLRDDLPTSEELAAARAAGGTLGASIGGSAGHASTSGGPIRFMGGPGEAGALVLGETATALPAQLQERLTAMRKAHALRALDEDARWEKAQTDLGLSYNQVAELQAAIEERKEAQAAARTQTEITTEGGATTIRANIDSEKMQAARKAYDERVAATLSDEQREGWKNDGYDQAFGGGGGPTMISFTGDIHVPSRKSDEPK